MEQSVLKFIDSETKLDTLTWRQNTEEMDHSSSFERKNFIRHWIDAHVADKW